MACLPRFALPGFLLAAPSAAIALDPAALQLGCASGQAADCLALARAQTGVGLPVDLLAARASYESACRLGAAEGCQGAQGLSRHLGRHVELALLTSQPRVWVVAGPSRVDTQGRPGAAAPGDAEAVEARLPFAEACYRAAIEDNPQVEGLLDLSLHLRGGAVTEVALHQASLADEDAARCIAEELGRARPPTGSPDGQLFLRLRAEPAPAASAGPPVVQDHLADGTQLSIGDPSSGPGDRRLEVAFTVAVRQALAGTSCALDEAAAGRWEPAALSVQTSLQPDGQCRGLRVTPSPAERRELADCLGRELQTLRIGQTGLEAPVDASLVVRIAPAWTATLVP